METVHCPTVAKRVVHGQPGTPTLWHPFNSSSIQNDAATAPTLGIPRENPWQTVTPGSPESQLRQPSSFIQARRPLVALPCVLDGSMCNRPGPTGLNGLERVTPSQITPKSCFGGLIHARQSLPPSHTVILIFLNGEALHSSAWATLRPPPKGLLHLE